VMEWFSPILGGVGAGLVIWAIFVRPFQLRNHERERRQAGLKPKYKLPEDEANAHHR
jgi:hypothetical protein